MPKYLIKCPSADVSTKIIAEVFLRPLDPSLVVEASDELSLQKGDASTVYKNLNSMLQSLSTDCNTLVGETDEEKQVASTWIEKLISSGEDVQKAYLKDLDDHLQPRTFMLGSKLSAVDLIAYTHLHSYFSSAGHQDILKHPSVTRHFDFIQNHVSVRKALTEISSTRLPLIPIDVANVPEVERKAIIPEKKDKKAKIPTAEDAPIQNQESASKEAQKPSAGGEKQKKEKKKGGGGGGGGGAESKNPPAAADGPPMPHMIDMRIGKIVHVEKHPDADSLYVEKIDFGEPEPRTVVSGLVNYIPIEEMRDRLLVGICNLKPANMRGVKSFAMVLAATSKDGKGGAGSVELVAPPPGSQPGDRVYFEGFEDQKPIEQLNPKKKQFETIQPNFTTLDTREACWTDPQNDHKPHRIMTSRGVCCAPTFVGASLS